MFMGVGRVGRQMPAGAGGPIALVDMSLLAGPLSGRVAFSRAAGPATYFDTSGILQTVGTNVPRFDNDPATLAPRGLLIEEPRTNSLQQSGDFTNAIWIKGSGATLAAGTPGPNGASTGSGIISAVGSIGFMGQSFTPIAATAYTLSNFVKAGSLTAAILLMPTAWWADATLRTATFNLSNGTITGTTGTGATATIIPVGNGWYRCSMTATPDTAASGVFHGTRASANGDGVTIQHYAFGVQLEAGAFSTSYIPTVGASATRPAELANMPLFNLQQGTLVVDYMSAWLYANQVFASLGTAGDPNNTINLRSSGVSPGVINGTVFTANTNVGSATSVNTQTNFQISKAALTYVGSAEQLVLNGGAVASGAPSSLPANINALNLAWGRLGIAGDCWIRRLRLWGSAFTAAQIQALTT